MNTQEQHPVPDSPPAPASSRKSVGRHLVMVLAPMLPYVVADGLLVALRVHRQIRQTDLLRWQSVSAGIKRWGLLLQCLTLAAIGLWWRAIVDWGLRKGYVKQHELAQVMALRWTVLAFGIAYLVLVPIGPTTLWRYLMP